MRGRLFFVLTLCFLGPVVAQTTTQHIVVTIDSASFQRQLDRESRGLWDAQPLLLTPQFEVVEPVSGVRGSLKVLPGGVWTAELEVPVPQNPRQLQRLALVPLASAGPDAVRAIAQLQQRWSDEDVWPLVRGVLAWAWGPRDPRFTAKNQTLALSYPVQR